MSKTTTAIAKTTKYKVGQWVSSPDSVWLLIVGMIDSGMGPMYALMSPKQPDSRGLRWQSEYEMLEEEMTPGEPNYKGCRALKIGDILTIGSSDGDQVYATILARVGDAVLLSQTPDKSKVKMMEHMDRVMSEMGEEMGFSGGLLDEKDRKRLKRQASTLSTAKMAGRWMSVDQIALMNWELAGDE